MVRSIGAIVLKYEEPGWTEQTIKCLEENRVDDYIVVSRQGTGPISSAFNEGMRQISHRFDWVWMLTNVGFCRGMLASMVELLDENVAAIHPAFDSDHPHLKHPKGHGAPIPFVEWTAPLVNVEAWNTVGELDEQMPYWGMDLDWSYRASHAGYYLLVASQYRLRHVYLVNAQAGEHRITAMRRQIRAGFDKSTEDRLIEKYGYDWIRTVWPTHPYLRLGRETIY